MKLRAVPDTPPRAVLYLRQSEYREESVSFEIQEAAGRDYCARHGYVVVAVEKDGSTGRIWKNRPGVQRSVAMIESHDAEVIVLWKWSRLSRSRKHWPIAADMVDVAGGRIESATEPIDTTTASGRFARGVMIEYSAFQSEQIGETWEEVRQRRLRLGLPASGRLPWGWEWVKGIGIRSIPERAEVVVEMYRRYLAGHGSSAISRWLNANAIAAPNGGLWNRARPFTVMDSPIHAGLVPYRGVEHPGAHEGIIDQATWQAYKVMRGERREGHAKPRQSKYLLSGLVKCGCGLRMTGKGATTGGIWYSGYICTSMDPEHGRNYLSSKKLDPIVALWIAGLVDEIDAEVDMSPRIEDEGRIQRLEAEWIAHQGRIDKLTRLLIDGVIAEPSYRATRLEVEGEQHGIEQQLQEARGRLAASPIVPTAIVRDLASDWGVMPEDIRHDLVRVILREVVIVPGVSATFTSQWNTSSVMSL